MSQEELPVSDEGLDRINFINVLLYYRDELTEMLENPDAQIKELFSEGERKSLLHYGVLQKTPHSNTPPFFTVTWAAETALEKISHARRKD